MDPKLLVDNGDVISYALAGVLAVVGLVVVQLVRRRRDLRKARDAVRLVTYSIAEPRPGPVAVKEVWRAGGEPRIECGGERVFIEGEPDVQRGTRARWARGVRTYAVREGEAVIAIGVMAKRGDHEWSFAASPGEAGVQMFAVTPRPAPAPLLPWRAPLVLAITGAVAFLGLYGAGTLVVDVPHDCSDTSVLRLQISSALPLVRDEALAALARCHK
ncbi:MAG: hypothetical protein ACM31C_11500 [Acidobacteriota bacterium]